MTISLTEGENTVNIPLVAQAIPVANVTFTVVDSVTGSPISGVTVTLASITVTTGIDGKCRLEGITEGNYSISFAHPNYVTLTDTLSFHP